MTENCNFDSKEDENSTNEGRILRSGRSTPVCIETDNLKAVATQKPVPQRKTKVKKKSTKKESSKELVKQESDVNSDDVKSILLGIKTEEDLDINIVKNMTTRKNKNEANTKLKKQRSKVGNQKSKSFVKAGTAQGIKSAHQKGGKVNKPKSAPKSRRQRGQVNSSNVSKNKCEQVAKTKAFNVGTTANTPKKVSAIEKLKVRAFDQLKEKLEIAIDRSSISVPECAKLLQQITSPNLSEIFYGQPASVDEGSSESLVVELAGKSFPDIMSERMRKDVSVVTKESAVNLSEAAQALVSFKCQTASATSRINLDQEAPLSHEFNNSSSSVTQTIVEDIQNKNNLANTSFLGQQFVKNNNQFDSAISIPRKTGNISSKTTPMQAQPGEEKSATPQSAAGMQSITSQGVESNNSQVLGSSGLAIGNDSHVKSTSPESLTVGFSSSSPFLPVNNLLLPTTNPLVPTTSQLVHFTNTSTPSTNQVFSTINALLPTTNQAPPSTNSVIPTTNQVLSTLNPLLPTNPAPSLTNCSIPTTNQVLTAINSLLPTANQVPPSTNSLLPTANRLVQTNHPQPTTNPLISTTNQLLYSLPSASTSADAAFVAISPALPVVQASNVLTNQPQLTFQLLQPQGTIPTPPTVVTTSQTQATQLCSSTATTPSQPATLLTAPLNQQLFLPRITPPIDQKTLGSNLPTILPGIKTPNDLLLPKTVSTVTQQHAGTVPATSGNEMATSCKLRPILPRQPLVSPTFTLTNPSPALQIGKNVPNVKKAVRRLVSGRTKNTNLSTQQTTSLPDIASTFNKSIFTKNIEPAMAPGHSNTEMANKEQAIKALLSIGSEQQTAARQEAKGIANVTTSKTTESKKTDDLLVVFDTNKEIFKVDDVIIDPQINTISKGNYCPSSFKTYQFCTGFVMLLNLLVLC